MARKKSDVSTIALIDHVGIEQASDIKKQLAEGIKAKSKICVDLTKISDIDTSVIQLLISAKNDAEAHEKEFYIQGPIPEEIQNLLNLLSISLPVRTPEGTNV